MEILDLSKMTIREIESKIKHYELQLEYYLNVKEKMFNKTQPKSVEITDEMVQGGKRSNVIFDYVISVEETDIKIDELQDEINRLTGYIEGELKRLGKYEPLMRKIVELKELENLNYEQIATKVNYCSRQVRRIYSRYRGERNV